MKLLSLSEELKNNSYPGRGIVIGKSADGKAPQHDDPQFEHRRVDARLPVPLR